MGNKPSSFAKSQASPPSKWPDGTRKSLSNAFTSHLDDSPSIFASAQDQALATRSASSTAAVERSRARGIEPAMVYGLSHRSEDAKRTRGRPAAVKVPRA